MAHYSRMNAENAEMLKMWAAAQGSDLVARETILGLGDPQNVDRLGAEAKEG